MTPSTSTAVVPDVIVAGHLCLDIIPAMTLPDSIEPGRLIQVGPPRFAAGGAVGNTGLALHRLGVGARLIGCVGDDPFADLLRNIIHRQGVEHVTLALPDAPTSYSVVISPPGVDRSFLHCPGVNDAMSPAQIGDELLRGARLLHFGYPPAMRRTYDDGGEALADLFTRAQRLGLATSLDLCGVSPSAPAARADWAAFFDRVLPHVDCFTPSYDELCVLLRRDADQTPARATLRELAAFALDRGCAMAVVKLGSDGLFARLHPDARRFARLGAALTGDAGREYVEPCFTVNVHGTTAAGDSTIAGLIAGLLAGESAASMLRTATAVGACCVEQADAVLGVPTLDRVRARLAGPWPKRASAVR